MIADTTLLIDLLIGREDATNFLKYNYITTTSISVFEIFQGSKENEKTKIESLFKEIPVFPLDYESAKLAGNFMKDLKGVGSEVSPEDCMIAAIAIKKGLPIASKNEKHFNRFKGLSVKKY